MFCRFRAVRQTGTHVRAGSGRRRFSTCARRAPVRPGRQKSAARIFARKPRSSRVQSKCVASFPKIENDCFGLNLQMFKKSTSALALSFLLVLDSSAREPQKHPPTTPFVENKTVRARDLGIPFEGTPGKFNAITDVAGVEVGYTTLIRGEGKLEVGKGPVRTGVTVIVPRGHDSLNDPVYAGFFSLNGNGEMTGTAWLEESGFLEGPIVITNTHSVGIARDAVITWRVKQAPADKTGYWWSLPVVAETWVGWLGGAKTTRTYTIGALVQADCGRRAELLIAGVPVGREIPGQVYKEETGSIIIAIATDAPLLPHQLKRLAKRASLGLARTGSVSANGSGDLFIAFSTANAAAANPDPLTHSVETIPNDRMDPIFTAVVQATEEAIVNALVDNQTMTGRDNHRVDALPRNRLRELLKKYNRLR